MSGRDMLAAAVVGGAFVVAVALLWACQPPSDFDVGSAALCLVVLVAAIRVRFETPLGYTVPTQLAFVPLLFAVPLATVPILVALGFALARLPEVVKRETPPSKLAWAVTNAWFSIGPTAVFVIAGVQPRDATAELLLLALASQFVVDFAASTLGFAISVGASFWSQLREGWWVYAVDAALSGIGLVVAEDLDTHPAAVLAILPLLGVLAVFARERHHRLQGLLELHRAYRGTAIVLAEVVEADDDYTAEHCRDVEALALAVAERLEMNPARRRNLEFAALLHDVGKIAIPKEVINKPGKLDPDEWDLIRTHTIVGQRMLAKVGGFMREVGQIVRSHHERWDGGGYPDGLAADAIPLEARIIACCDSWNAMRTDRSYRKALPHKVALAEMQRNAGTQFDPDVVDVFIEVVGAFGETATEQAASEQEPHVDPEPARERAAA